MLFLASSISSCVGGSATMGTGLAAPFGTQDIEEIIPAAPTKNAEDGGGARGGAVRWSEEENG